MKTLQQKSKQTAAFVFALCLALTTAFAQPPQKFNYQAVARNSAGVLLTSITIGYKISICTDDAGTNVVYTQEALAATNANGLLTLEIGGDASFSSINWGSGSYWIKTEIDPDGLVGGISYSVTGISQLLSVPYALNAGGGSWMTNGNDIYSGNSGNVGIGTTTPQTRLDVRGVNAAITVGEDGATGGALYLGNGNHGIQRGFPYLNTDNNVGLFTNAGNIFLSSNGQNTGEFVLTGGKVGIGTSGPSAPLQVRASGTGLPSENGLYVYNENFSTGENSIICTRVAGTGTGNPFYSMDISGVAGWSMGIDNADQYKFKIAPSWSDITFNTALSIDQSGNVGIGTTTPNGKLEIKTGSYSAIIDNTGYNNAEPCIHPSAGNYGNVGSETNYWYRVYAATYYGTNTSIQSFSDRRLKEDIHPLSQGLAELMKLKPVSYNFIPEKLAPNEEARKKLTDKDIKNQMGLIAQDVQEVFPQLVRTLSEKSDILTIGYSGLIPVLVKGIQEQQAQIDELKKQIQELKANK